MSRLIAQKGLSLVEVMIALALSALLLIGIFQIFNSNKQAFQLQDGYARVQESGRLAMEMLNRDIRNAAYTGCSNGVNFNSIVEPSKYKAGIPDFDSSKGIVAYNNISSIASGSELNNFGLTVGTASGQVIAGTDAIVIKGASPCDGGKVVSYNQSSASFKIEDAKACGINQNDIVVVSNCQYADMFAITNNPISGGSVDTVTHGANWNVSPPKLDGSYSNDSFLLRYTAKVYYVANGANSRPSLFVTQLEGTTLVTHELAEGISDMQFLMGEDSSGGDKSVDRFLEPEDAALVIGRIVAVKTSFTLESEDNVLTVSGNPLTTTFQSVSTLRNRVN
ncbi:PilW family protein [Hahella sp. NBU794]|uniref:PilW family protein n=1 Tax=Hahella sp. NBU794 TaxID=3422590 RepID=UPI003D6EE591